MVDESDDMCFFGIFEALEPFFNDRFFVDSEVAHSTQKVLNILVHVRSIEIDNITNPDNNLQI